ncbi:unnamed protein product [Fusarium graminearum]|uniref:Chromosome 2, complete genome n=1 Tax=Gibberella zeae (strain ATCC MYA-4620 / CBS 123657 / FGSC 9075 / NRRL 31084 / PH-1) TaxID=229533 RepID=A0A098DHX4_GIBZE|nr:unnamed protein product [Fusarium graminearum]
MLVELIDSVDTAHNRIESFPAGHDLKLPGVQFIKTEIDPGQSVLSHGFELSVQSYSIRVYAKLP